LVRFVALSYAPRQYELKRAVDEEILVAAARLSFAASPLDTVHVIAPRALSWISCELVPLAQSSGLHWAKTPGGDPACQRV
jgi:hypothetical protein